MKAGEVLVANEYLAMQPAIFLRMTFGIGYKRPTGMPHRPWWFRPVRLRQRLAGQIARNLRCRVVGIAGGPEKGRHVREDLSFDDCIDYRAEDLSGGLRGACPAGVNVYFENVGGAVRDPVLPLMNQSGRVALCGLISE